MRRVFFVFALPAITLVFLFNASAQSKQVPRKKPPVAGTRSSVVTTELDRQRLFLQNVTSRYEAVSINDFTPYFSYEYVWKALKENRDSLSRQASSLTPTQSLAVRNGYELLEQDVLENFVEQQLGVLVDELELNGVQVDEVQKLLAHDLKLKKLLLSSRRLRPEAFTQRMTALSETTEKQILARLFPEQREKFRRQVTFLRDRFIG
jgi:hypothetical protein